ncbi:hypothetical protein [Urbifossiella limnaea]|uniref:Uncharacterized protein n=1 Tax=Urbifossiella limnaea TaxID=2528023 RepID=A0A517Y255_9BACT|nr:hypothetical protein [Urbifossiella limnaea]QDU23819.1 hypothetical protein ETAA1_58270 [Urbifossiella limnaea]
MDGTGPVAVNGSVVYGYWTDRGGACRLRLGLDDWDRLGLHPGQRVRVGRGDQPPEEVLIAAADRHPPVVWLDLVPVARTNTTRAG